KDIANERKECLLSIYRVQYILCKDMLFFLKSYQKSGINSALASENQRFSGVEDGEFHAADRGAEAMR
ncbi:MAG: hypothetical protein ACI4TW_05040, partial [Prevotella sp.]